MIVPPMNPGPRKILDRKLLGKIAVARLLELPLPRFDLFVRRLESGPEFLRLSEAITVGSLPGANLATISCPNKQTIGEIDWNRGYPELHYHSSSFIREYLFDDPVLDQIILSSFISGENKIRKTVHRLRLVNTRNRLTHALTHFIIQYQSEYFRTGDPTHLLPLTQSRISAGITEGGLNPGITDSSRISRLIRTLQITGCDGRDYNLSALVPSSRKISCYLVSRMIEKENVIDLEGNLVDPMTDEEVSERIGAEYGAFLSRRTVAHIRRKLGIPDWKERQGMGVYHKKTVGFSLPMSLSSPTLKSAVPDEPGVYEIWSFVTGRDSEGVVYIGSAGNLRKRLSHHLQGRGKNPLLREKISRGARFRYQICKESWRTAERELFRAFRATFGTSPECNRISP